jgi:hypothetical protein
VVTNDVQEGAAVPSTTAVAENAVAMVDSRSQSKLTSRLRARSRSLLESVVALWFSGEAISCLIAEFFTKGSLSWRYRELAQSV